MNRRWLGPLLSVILIVGVGAALFVSIRNTLLNQQKITVSGLIGSEKRVTSTLSSTRFTMGRTS